MAIAQDDGMSIAQDDGMAIAQDDGTAGTGRRTPRPPRVHPLFTSRQTARHATDLAWNTCPSRTLHNFPFSDWIHSK
ncbi:hypothetical protein D3248_03275 [Leucobacter zeae]|nr:hypothetical protein [Leucobacter zeae]